MPKISVIIPTFNCSKYLPEAIESVLRQTYPDFEIIIVDDGSTDNTKDTVEKCISNNRNKIYYYYQDNRGPSAAKNKGIQEAKGEYIAFLDADDEFYPELLQTCAELISQKNADWCFTDLLKIQNGAEELQSSAIPDGNEIYYSILQEDFIRIAPFFRKSVLLQVGLFDIKLKIREDWDLNIRMISNKKSFVYINKPLYIYKIRVKSLTKNNLPEALYFTKLLLEKHHKKLSNLGDKKIREIYSNQMWDLSRAYLKELHDINKSFYCIKESIVYDFNFERVLRAINFNIKNMLSNKLAINISPHLNNISTKQGRIKKMQKIKKIISLLARHPGLFFDKLYVKIKTICKSSIQKKINEILFEFDFNFDPAIKNMYESHYESGTVRLMQKTLKKGDTFIDVGANIGYLSAIALGLVGKSGQVHSFEPVPKYFYKLNKVAIANKGYKIFVNQCALGEKQERAKINVTSELSIGWNTIVPNFMSNETIKETIEVNVIRLDRYINEKKLNNIKFIKIDVEGFEFLVLRGISSYFQNGNNRPLILCEIAPTAYPLLGFRMADLSEYMKKYNYRAFDVINTDTEIDITKLERTQNVIFIYQKC